MTETPDEKNDQRSDYENTQALFLAGLDVLPAERDRWLEQQTQYSPHIRQAARAMLRSDEEAEQALEQRRERQRWAAKQETIAPPTDAGGGGGVWTSADKFPEIDNYEILEEVARGGMGIVYKARQLRPNRLAAVKMIRSGAFASKMEVERFMTEAEAAGQLDDEAVVPVYELGTVKQEPFIAMKFIDGDDLEALLSESQISLEACLAMLMTICRAVGAAHDKEIIHRDLKPSNILVDRATQRPWITDFGLAKYLNLESTATAAGEVLGTPGYMAPEQAAGDSDAISKATDVYGLGAILYRMLTGRPPIQVDGGNMVRTLSLIQEHDISSPKSLVRRIPNALDTICMRCLECEPKQRYQDANELADDLQRFLDGEAIQAKPLGWMKRVHRWARHRPGLSATWCCLVVFFVYHCLYRWLSTQSDTAFNIATLIFFVVVGITAWVWQTLLTRSQGAPWVLFGWLTSDVTLLTVYLFFGASARSPLCVLYNVVVAGSVLRCRTDLVAYVTGLSMVGYCIHIAYVRLARPDLTLPFGESIPLLLSLLVIGVVQYFSLRQSASSFESQSADRVV